MASTSTPNPSFYHIGCPRCQTSFRIPTDSIQAAGRDVRCSVCSNVWRYRARVKDLRSTEELSNQDAQTDHQDREHDRRKKSTPTPPSAIQDSTDLSGLDKTPYTDQPDLSKSALVEDESSSTDDNYQDPTSKLRRDVKTELQHVVSIVQSLRDDISETITPTSQTAENAFTSDRQAKTSEQAETREQSPTDLRVPEAALEDGPKDSNISAKVAQDDPDDRAVLHDMLEQIQDEDIPLSQKLVPDTTNTITKAAPSAVDTETTLEIALPPKPEDQAASFDQSSIGDPIQEESFGKSVSASSIVTQPDPSSVNPITKDDQDQTIDQEKLAREWEASLALAFSIEDEDEDENIADSPKTEASVDHSEDSLPDVHPEAADGPKTADKDQPSMEKASLLSPIISGGEKQQASPEDTIPTEGHGEEIYSETPFDSQIESNPIESSTVSSDDYDSAAAEFLDDITIEEEQIPSSDVAADSTARPPEEALPAKKKKSFFSRFASKKKVKPKSEIQEDSIFSAQFDVSPDRDAVDSQPDGIDARDAISQHYEQDTSYEEHFSYIEDASDTKKSRSSTIFSRLREKSRAEEEKRQELERKHKSQQQERIESDSRLNEERQATALIKSKKQSRVKSTLGHSVGTLVGIGLIGLTGYGLFTKSDEIVAKWPELSIIYRQFGIEKFAPGEVINLSRPEISVSPVDVDQNELKMRGTLSNNYSDEPQSIPDLFVMLRSKEGRIIDQWEVNIPQETLEPGETIEYAITNTIPPVAEDLILGFRISSIRLEEEYLFLDPNQ